ncbi:MAG: hypothetical protein ICV78_10010 [Tolypothrix sp. Co-bin9]|nr:hypothetical protein [Tolypothrix sp. Co-bin9]
MAGVSIYISQLPTWNCYVIENLNSKSLNLHEQGDVDVASKSKRDRLTSPNPDLKLQLIKHRQTLHNFMIIGYKVTNFLQCQTH